jgi:redox-sensitive bicupin YhaK (pirin superfamily)
MITIRRAQERGRTQWEWLDSWHSFSFGDYHDPRAMGFRALRVINEDFVDAGAGFPRHPHRDMEIITYVLEGALQHKDSLGNGSIINPGDGQRMTAGRGILHSEQNASKDKPVHLLQIWILPEARGLEPGYEQRAFAPEDKHGKLRLIASPDAANGSVKVHQDVELFAAVLEPGQKVEHVLRPGRHAWIQVARGAVELNGSPLVHGDGAAVSDEAALTLRASEPSEVLLFDLA